MATPIRTQSPFLLDPNNPLAEQYLGLERQQKLADLLTSKAAQQPQGQMVSGRFVAPSWAEQLNPVFSAIMGQELGKATEQKQLSLAEQLRKQKAQGIQEFMASGQEVPEQATYGAGMEGPTKTVTVAAKPAMPYDQRLANLARTNPELADMLMAERFKTQKKNVEEELYTIGPDGKPVVIAPGVQKSPEKIQTAAIVLGLDKKPRDQWTAQDRAAVDAQIQKTQQSGAVNLGQKGLDNTLKLRSDFRSEPTYKAFQEVDSAWRQIGNGLNAKTPAGDLAAATKFMKLLDPGSVVRESELTMAMQTTGGLQKLENYANKLVTGGLLNDKQREEFRALANDFYNSAGEQYNSKRNEYAQIAQRNDINVEDVAGKPVTLKQATKAAPVASPKIGTVQDGYRFKGGNPADPKNWERAK